MFDTKTHVMGILNVTPDSFSDGGEYYNKVDKALKRAKELIEEGADSIDIGGESTASYTGTKKISEEEELQRVIPVILAIRKNLGDNIILSIDTYKSNVAKEAVKSGVNIINDPSGLQLDPEMAKTVFEMNAKVIINHMQGNIETMFIETFPHKDIINDLINFFANKINQLQALGVKKEKIILDPGLGFRKTVDDNIAILNNIQKINKFDLPFMIGISRKSTIGKILFESFGREFRPIERVEGSFAATAIAFINGAKMVRTHDVLATKKFLAVLERIKS